MIWEGHRGVTIAVMMSVMLSHAVRAANLRSDRLCLHSTHRVGSLCWATAATKEPRERDFAVKLCHN